LFSKRFLIAIFSLLLLQACKHPLAIEGEGDIVERLAGVRGCTLQEFQADDPRCTENEVLEADYLVSYEAIPHPGWVFTGWEGTGCSVTTDEGYCEYNMPQAFVDFTDENWPGVPFPPTTAVFKLLDQAVVDAYASEIADQVVSAGCQACHVEAGAAGFTRLVFDANPSDEQNAINIDAFRSLIQTEADGVEFILSKTRGDSDHQGGSVFSASSDEYQSLENFLGLLEDAVNAAAKAGLIVTGTEVSPGSYSFVISQSAVTDPIQTKTFIPLNFQVSLPSLVLGSPGGTLTDGTTTLVPALSGWTDATGAAPSMDPNLITGTVTAEGTPGIDFSVTEVPWFFGSEERLEGFVE
jgi:hypothetical protein